MFYSLSILTTSGSYEPVLRVFQTIRAAQAAARRFARMSNAKEVAVYKGGLGGMRVFTARAGR